MELLLPLLAALLIGTGVFLLLSRALIRLIVGISLISYGANLSILIAGAGLGGANPPLLDMAGPHVDPLPQALILTAIVIGFGTTALLLVLATRAYQVTGTDHVQELVERPDPMRPPVIYADPEQPSVSPEQAENRAHLTGIIDLTEEYGDDESATAAAEQEPAGEEEESR